MQAYESPVMASFTSLTAPQFQVLCGQFGLGELKGFEPIDAGTINSNYAARTDAGRFFVRVNEGKRDADVTYEAELVAELAAAGVQCPAPLRCGGQRYARLTDVSGQISVFPWLEGSHRSAGAVTEQDAHAVGAALAVLHRAGAPLAQRFARAGTYRFADICRRLATFRDTDDPVLAPHAAQLCAEAEWLAQRASVFQATPRGIVHTDLFRDNVLFDGAQLIALIDFEQACVGSWVYDLAVCLNAWCYSAGLSPTIARSLLAGYQSIRPLNDLERKSLWIDARRAAMRFAVTRITDLYLVGIDKPDKDFRRYTARLAAWQDLGESGLLSLLA